MGLTVGFVLVRILICARPDGCPIYAFMLGALLSCMLGTLLAYMLGTLHPLRLQASHA